LVFCLQVDWPGGGFSDHLSEHTENRNFSRHKIPTNPGVHSAAARSLYCSSIDLPAATVLAGASTTGLGGATGAGGGGAVLAAGTDFSTAAFFSGTGF
jgi:hypothetical protein